jgi:hypothetical protein
MPDLTIQKLANLLMYSWEVQQVIGFHNKDPHDFKAFVQNAPPHDLKIFLENLGLLFRTAEEIGQSRVELTAQGQESLFAPLANTGSSVKAGSPEAILPPAIIKAIDDAVARRLSGEKPSDNW